MIVAIGELDTVICIKPANQLLEIVEIDTAQSRFVPTLIIPNMQCNIPSGMIKYAWQHPIQTIAGGYAATKAVGLGSKLFKGRAVTDTGKGEDITSEGTGGGTTETKGPPLSGGAQGLNNFVDAHNTALSSGQDYFVFEGKYFNVGKTQLSQF